MKKLLIFPAVLLTLSGFLLKSCESSDSAGSMQKPMPKAANANDQNEKKEQSQDDANKEGNEKTSLVKQVSMIEGASAKAKTIDNLKAAFRGETTASEKYAAYSKKAEQEGYREIALLFKAASMAEKIHANNHRSVLQESGEAAPTVTPIFSIGSTKENLQDAIKGETYEVTTMYPGFINAATASGSQLALISLNYAYKTEIKHKSMYEKALVALEANSGKTLPSVYFVCPTCGNTYEIKAPARCGISMTSSEKFIRVTS